MPLSTDIFQPWGMFSSVNYIPVLHGLGWFDTDKIKEQYETYHRSVIESYILSDLEYESQAFTVSHKKLVKEIINAR